MKFPNRIFVGGLPKSTDAKELATFFERFGIATEAKIILDRNGDPKGYTFIIFQCKKEYVDNVISHGVIFFKGRKLNLGPAVRKQAPDMKGETVLLF